LETLIKQQFVEGIALAHKYPDVNLYISGGNGSFIDQKLNETDCLKLLAERLGISSERIIFERNSHNTHESASAIAEILDEKKDGKWL
jgi:uncharacterized SAM-binding protein YcdF (DUF218 family)|tara:strand:+ start:90 stop:353 length:264 start_codon:yes stop_codon:yes gene_type:complete